MQYHIASRLAIAVGIAASGCALGILLQDAIRTGIFTLEHALIPGMVGIAIAAGHLVGTALRSRKYLSALGFAVSFALATLLTVYTSVSKQADQSETVISAVSVTNTARKGKEDELARTRTRYEQANVMAEREMTGQKCLARCADWKTRSAEVAARVEKLEGELKDMAPPKPVTVGADKMAKVITMFVVQDVERVKAMLLLLEPFAKALLFELTAIVAFGFGFGHRRAVKLKKPARVSAPDPKPAPPGSEDRVVDWVREFRRRHGRNPQIPEVQREFGLPKTSAWRKIKAA